MADTTIPETHRDLLDSDVAILATIAPDGRPQLSAIWFLAEDGVIRTSLNTSRHKVKNLRTNPATTLFILDRDRPTRYLEVRGDARVEDDPDYRFADKLGSKYGANLRDYDGPGAERVVVTVDPTRVNAVDMEAGH